MKAAEWASSDVVLLEGEIGFETDTGFAKFGDGQNTFSKLKYLTGPKGPKGDTGLQGKTGELVLEALLASLERQIIINSKINQI